MTKDKPAKKNISKFSNEAFRLAPMYMVLFIGNAVYQNNIPNYLRSASLSDQWIGTLLGLVPIAGMIGQVVFGAVGDRVRYKNTPLFIITLLAAGAAVLLGFVDALPFIATGLCAYAFFQMSMEPLLNAVTLETLEKTKGAFGPIRMAGTIAFAICSPLIGLVINNDYGRVPFMLAIVLGVSAFVSLLLPKVQGHARKGRKAPITVLLKNKQLLVMTGFTFCLMVSMSFYYSFFPAYFTSEAIGGSSFMLGVCYAISALSEIPFLLNSDRIFNKLGVGKMLMISAATMTLRWILLGTFTHQYAIIATQLLHCMGFIVLTFSMAKFVNLVVPDELKASGQMMLTLIGLTLSRSIGAIISGQIAEFFGMQAIFWAAGIVSILSLIIFGFFILRDPALSEAGTQRKN